MFSRLFGCAILLTAAVWTSAAEPRNNSELFKIGMLKSMVRDVSGPKFEALSANFEKVMKQQTGLKGDLVIVEKPEEVRKKLEQGDIQLAAFYSFEFAWLREKHPQIEPLMLSTPEPAALVAVIVVNKDNPAKNLADLKGKKLILPGDTREDTRLFLERQAKQSGIAVSDLQQPEKPVESPEDALDAVVDGEADVTAVTQAAMQMLQRRKPARFAKLKVLSQSEPFPPAVIGYMKGKLDDTTIRKFRDGMATAHTTAQGNHLMSLLKIKRFEAVPRDFPTKLSEIAKQYPQEQATK